MILLKIFGAIIGLMILARIVINILGRLGRFFWLTFLLSVICGVVIYLISDTWWLGLVCGFVALGIISWCEELVQNDL